MNWACPTVVGTARCDCNPKAAKGTAAASANPGAIHAKCSNFRRRANPTPATSNAPQNSPNKPLTGPRDTIR